MNQSLTPIAVADRRTRVDRRRRPTSFWSIWTLRGRRRGFRREEESYDRYVDRPTGETVCLTLGVLCASLLDAWFTLIHLDNGGREVNPIMQLALLEGTTAFVAVKTCVTAAGVAFLAPHQNFRFGKIALRAVAIVYALLLAYHGLLFLTGP